MSASCLGSIARLVPRFASLLAKCSQTVDQYRSFNVAQSFNWNVIFHSASTFKYWYGDTLLAQ
jgi:hypothetical protein